MFRMKKLEIIAIVFGLISVIAGVAFMVFGDEGETPGIALIVLGVLAFGGEFVFYALSLYGDHAERDDEEQ